MISRDGRLQRGEHVNLTRAADLEDGAAAIADIEILVRIERDAGGDAHAFHIDRAVPGRRDLVDDARHGGWKRTASLRWSNARPVAFIRSVTRGLELWFGSIL